MKERDKFLNFQTVPYMTVYWKLCHKMYVGYFSTAYQIDLCRKEGEIIPLSAAKKNNEVNSQFVVKHNPVDHLSRSM